MKKIASVLCFCILSFSCSNSDDNDSKNVTVSIKFSQNWDGTEVTSTDFNAIKYTNANGEEMSIERLRYLISNIVLENSEGGKATIMDYNLIDVGTNSGLMFNAQSPIPTGTYNLSFTFGFNNDDNSQIYQDLNSASWSVPAMLGGGYHYMQLEGKFMDNTDAEIGYAYHAIRAADISVSPIEFEDTFFTIDLGEIVISNNATIEIQMNIAEWFKNAKQWDLNVLHNMLMPNFNAQLSISANGKNAFSLGNIEQ